MCVLRTGTRKNCHLPRENGHARMDIGGIFSLLYCFLCFAVALRKMIRARLRGRPHASVDNTFRPISHVKVYLGQHQLQYLDSTWLRHWVEVAARERQWDIRRQVTTPVKQPPAGKPQGNMTMSGNVQLVLYDIIDAVLGPGQRAEWTEHRLTIELTGLDGSLWKHTAGSQNGLPWRRPAVMNVPGRQMKHLPSLCHYTSYWWSMPPKMNLRRSC